MRIGRLTAQIGQGKLFPAILWGLLSGSPNGTFTLGVRGLLVIAILLLIPLIEQLKEASQGGQRRCIQRISSNWVWINVV